MRPCFIGRRGIDADSKCNRIKFFKPGVILFQRFHLVGSYGRPGKRPERKQDAFAFIIRKVMDFGVLVFESELRGCSFESYHRFPPNSIIAEQPPSFSADASMPETGVFDGSNP